jgi:hypothetical protein
MLPPYLVLLPMGFAEPSRSPGLLVSSYLTVSPLPQPKRRLASAEAVCFLWHFPYLNWLRAGLDGGRYPPSYPAESGLSSPASLRPKLFAEFSRIQAARPKRSAAAIIVPATIYPFLSYDRLERMANRRHRRVESPLHPAEKPLGARTSNKGKSAAEWLGQAPARVFRRLRGTRTAVACAPQPNDQPALGPTLVELPALGAVPNSHRQREAGP